MFGGKRDPLCVSEAAVQEGVEVNCIPSAALMPSVILNLVIGVMRA